MVGYVRPLHAWFAGFWVLWCAALVVYLWHLPQTTFADLTFSLSFLAAEGWAVGTRSRVEYRGSLVLARDTLSEFWTFVARMAKPDTPWWQSWNATVVLFALHPAWLVARQTPATVLDAVPFRIPVFGLMVGFLVWHWLRPDKVG